MLHQNADGLNKIRLTCYPNFKINSGKQITENKMIIIAFAQNTSKLLPQICCRAPRHCAPIIRVTQNHFIMYQFVKRGYVASIALNRRALELMQARGWCFIKSNHTVPKKLVQYGQQCTSCVEFCKYAIGIQSARPFTPRGLYKLCSVYLPNFLI